MVRLAKVLGRYCQDLPRYLRVSSMMCSKILSVPSRNLQDPYKISAKSFPRSWKIFLEGLLQQTIWSVCQQHHVITDMFCKLETFLSRMNTYFTTHVSHPQIPQGGAKGKGKANMS